MDDRFKDMKLTGDPDKDFAALLIAHHEDLIFLARTELEHGADEQLRQLAQRILDEQQKQISVLKEWQVRNRQADYRARVDQPPHGSGPLDQKGSSAPVAQVQPATPAQPTTQPSSASQLPMVSGTVEKVNAEAGRIIIDHGPIPNLNMDAMTMVFRAQDPALLQGVKTGDKVQFQADRVNGQISVVRIGTGRAQPAQFSAPPSAAANLPIVSGTVEKVDTAQGKITIDHGAIPNLNMDAMTMVFRAQNPAILKGVKASDKVQFQADRVNGQISLISIRKAR